MDLVQIYHCFCDRTRLRILNLLCEGPLCVCHFQELLNEPQVKDQFVSIGFELVGNTPAQFAAYQQQEFNRWKRVIETRKITVE